MRQFDKPSLNFSEKVYP